MASKPKLAKTLSVSKQRKTIKGVQKPKKNVVKNTLDSPFALDWPVLSTKHEEEIRSLLQMVCSGLKKLSCKPPWKELKKLKGAARKAFRKEYLQNWQESLDTDVVIENRKKEEILSHLIFGYNAVMRALEKDSLAGVVVKKNVEPTFVVKTFLPGCANKCIPLIPLDDLDNLLKNESMLALPHACMVLGLKPSVRDESNRFYPLFAKMCEAVDVHIEDDVNEEFDNRMECIIKNSVTEDKENQTCISSNFLTDEQIQLYHLKRTDKNKRVFIPGEIKEQKIDAVAFGSDFIGFESIKIDVPVQGEQLQLGRESAQLTKLKLKNLEKKGPSFSSLETMDLSNILFIDDKGDQEEDCVKQKSNSLEATASSKMKTSPLKKMKKMKARISPYVSATTKRVKNNQNRKTLRSGKLLNEK